MKNKVVNPDRITYSESIKINIGDFENRELVIGLTSDVRDDESFSKALDRVKKTVQKQTTKFERRIRNKTADIVDFDTRAKVDMGF